MKIDSNIIAIADFVAGQHLKNELVLIKERCWTFRVRKRKIFVGKVGILETKTFMTRPE